ncbi:hypothetical protein IAR55_002950 [Kwoniella newhampshirensis]|uniref:Pentatricopeptide repeat domain-containing protein n=1 Tax=Kwoniella newhampshirensis TaxID=1651941 RepID=A0AAW0YT03_9TREE
MKRIKLPGCVCPFCHRWNLLTSDVRSAGLGWTIGPPTPIRSTSRSISPCGLKQGPNLTFFCPSASIRRSVITLPGRSHSTPILAPSSTLQVLLDDPASDIRTILTALKSDTDLVSAQYLVAILRRPSDPSSIIRLMPSIIHDVATRSMEDSRSTFKLLVRHIGQHKMLALLPTIVDLFLRTTDSEMETGEVRDVEEIGKWYDEFVSSLRYFGKTTARRQDRQHIDPLPSPVRHEVTKIVKHFLDILSRLPSSSDPEAQPRLPNRFMSRLLVQRYMSPELRRLLLPHTSQHKIQLRPSEWHQFMLSALEEKDFESAHRFHAKKTAAIGRLLDDKNTGDLKFSEREDGATLSTQETPLTKAGRAQLKTLVDTIGSLVLTRNGRTWSELLATFEQFLLPSNPERPHHHSLQTDKLRRYAWSILLSRSSRDRHVKSEALIEMASSMPGSALVGHTLTPVMHGLLQRGAALEAWEIWRDLVQKERDASPSLKGMFVDCVTLGVATEVCHAVTNLDAAVALVDTWAHRPWMSEPNGSTTANSIQLDTQNINILLNVCRLEGRPSIAFRLWISALPRYGVHLDDISLTLLIDIARYCTINREDGKPDDLFRIRLRQMADEFRLRRKPSEKEELDDDFGGKYDAYDSMGFAKGSTAVLLDPPRYAWWDEFPNEKPWQRARRIVRQIVLGNWPHLRNVKSPLDVVQHGAFDSISSFFGGAGGGHVHRKVDHKEAMESTTTASTAILPSVTARYTHIIPTSNTFQSYISLLGYFKRHDDIPVVLAWMRSLSINPTWTTLQMALTYICEAEGPRRWIRGWGENGETALVRDEEIMRRWLEEWLGDGYEDDGRGQGGRRKVVPTEGDVAAHRRKLLERKEDLTA